MEKERNNGLCCAVREHIDMIFFWFFLGIALLVLANKYEPHCPSCRCFEKRHITTISSGTTVDSFRSIDGGESGKVEAPKVGEAGISKDA